MSIDAFTNVVRENIDSKVANFIVLKNVNNLIVKHFATGWSNPAVSFEYKDATIFGSGNNLAETLTTDYIASQTWANYSSGKGERAVELSKHMHSYSSEWISNETHHYHECTCGDKKDNAEHTFGEWTVTKEATETETGLKEKTCTVCSYKETETIPMIAHTHTFGNWTVTKEATETEVGSKERVCTECSYKQTEQIEKLPHTHSYSTDWKINETSHYKDCVCGDINDNEEHTYGEWTTVKEATETEVGSKERVCTICNHKQTEEIVKLPHTHNYSTDWKFDVTSHYKDCACGEKKDVANHEYTDDNDDTCNTCGFKRTINNPTPTPTPDPIEKDGLSGGAIAAIVVSSVLVLSLGGFSVFWFVIKKKSFKDLIKIFKK